MRLVKTFILAFCILECTKSGANFKIMTFEQTKEKFCRGEIHPFEAAKRLFAYGYTYERSGNSCTALNIYRETIDCLEDCFNKQTLPFSSLDYAKCALFHGRKLLELGKYDLAEPALKQALEVLNKSIEHGASFHAAAHIKFAKECLNQIETS